MRATWFCARALALTVVLAAAGCSDLSVSRTAPRDVGEYYLDSGDLLRIVVFGEEELSAEYTVDGSGQISMPLIHSVEARGLTTQGLEREIAERLKQGFLVDPSVNVQVVTFRPFYILGEVENPGQFPYANQLTVLGAVALAGGFTYRAKTSTVTITRTIVKRALKVQAEVNDFVLPGDVIFVHERFF